MNLLFLTPQLPYPPRQGTALRNWGLIKHLAGRHTITLLSFAEAGQAADALELRSACQSVVTVPVPRRTRADRLGTLFGYRAGPDLANRLWSPEFARALEALLHPGSEARMSQGAASSRGLRAHASSSPRAGGAEARSRFEIVQIEGLEMARYLTPLRAGGHKVIYDAHNAEHVIQRRAFATDVRRPTRWAAAVYSWIQLRRLQRFEAAACRAVDGVACVSEEDAAALRILAPSLNPVIVPNGIDVEEYSQYRQAPWAGAYPASRALLVFTGKMDYRPNLDAALWFAGDILPRIRAVRPEATFVVVGQNPPPAVTRLNAHNGVIVTGPVEDSRPHIAGAAVYVAPLRMGGGTRFKLLEAMALARPIVSTTVGAEGFALHSGRELLIADAPADFAAAVLNLLADPVRGAALGTAGQAFVRAGHDWSAIIPRLEALYQA